MNVSDQPIICCRCTGAVANNLKDKTEHVPFKGNHVTLIRPRRLKLCFLLFKEGTSEGVAKIRI